MLVRPVMVAVVAGGLPVTSTGAGAFVPVVVTVYFVITLPPFEGAVQLTTAEALPAVAVTLVGAPGAMAGVTALEGALATLVPIAFVAVTVKVYDVPLVRPVTVPVVAVAPVTTTGLSPPAGLAVIVYCVIALPPLLAGSTQVTVA